MKLNLQSKLPYIKKIDSFFSDRWKNGECYAIDKPQTAISMDKAPTGWKPPETRKSENSELKTKQQKPPASSSKVVPPADKSQEKKNEKEKCPAPPSFDMLDLPDAIEKMGFNVAAKLARRWFNGRAYILSDNSSAIYPDDMLDTQNVSLNFTLQTKGAKRKFDSLTKNSIYSLSAKKALRSVLHKFVQKKFIDEGTAYSGDIDTLKISGGDVQKMHNAFQFQRIQVSTLDTLTDNFGMTDLTASLGSFFFMAAIANAKIRTEKFYNYGNGIPESCCESWVSATHIYVYAKDSYSFADDKGKKSSQYLGHWNKYGMILVIPAAVSNAANTVRIPPLFKRNLHIHDPDFDFGNYPDTSVTLPYFYDNGLSNPLLNLDPVYIFKKLMNDGYSKKGVYYPVYNKNYNQWREKYNQGGDFVIYTNLKKTKLQKPIEFKIDRICKPSENFMKNSDGRYVYDLT